MKNTTLVAVGVVAALAVGCLMFCSKADAQVAIGAPPTPLAIYYNDGSTLYTPEGWEIVLQPKGFNTAPFTWEYMPGMHKGDWPFLKYFCGDKNVAVVQPAPDKPAVCDYYLDK